MFPPENCTVLLCSPLHLQIIPDVIRNVEPIKGLTMQASFQLAGGVLTFKASC